MAEDESSVLFSLKELMSIEEDRIQTEENERERAAREAEEARLEAERMAREAEEARQRAEEHRRQHDEQRQREESARLEAIRHAEMETARAEQEQRARMEAMTAQQHHERELARLKQDKHKKRLRIMLYAAITVGVLIVGGGGYLWYQSAQEKAAAIAAKDREAQRLKEQAQKRERELTAKLSQIKELEDKISRGANPEEIERLRKRLKNAQADAKKLGGHRYRPGGGAKPKAKTSCPPGDPLCSDL